MALHRLGSAPLTHPWDLTTMANRVPDWTALQPTPKPIGAPQFWSRRSELHRTPSAGCRELPNSKPGKLLVPLLGHGHQAQTADTQECRSGRHPGTTLLLTCDPQRRQDAAQREKPGRKWRPGLGHRVMSPQPLGFPCGQQARRAGGTGTTIGHGHQGGARRSPAASRGPARHEGYRPQLGLTQRQRHRLHLGGE